VPDNFLVAFEILGMLGRTLHIPDSCFRLLPNPTLYRWDRKNFSLQKMLASYQQLVDEKGVLERPNSVVLSTIKLHIRTLQTELENLTTKNVRSGWLSLPLLNVLHAALDDMDEVLTAKKKHVVMPNPRVKAEDRTTTQRSNHERHSSQNKLLESLIQTPNATEKPKDLTENPRERDRRRLVQDVLRSHLQEVLHMINEKTEEEPQSTTVWTFNTASGSAIPRFEDIDAAAPEDKQAKFMEVYFKVVLRKVITQSSTSTKRRLSVVPQGPITVPVPGIKRTGTAATHTSIAEQDDEDAIQDDDESTDPLEEAENGDVRLLEKRTMTEMTKTWPSGLWELEEVSHEDIWCTLVFRMVCWLMLHDFHKKDVQISKSELLGSRLPVYIA
jgi:hypothetical protein